MYRLLLILLCFTNHSTMLSAADLILLQNRKTDYQIVLPDQYPSDGVADCLRQVARLMQTAFRANGTEIPIVKEQQRQKNLLSIYLGNTQFARDQGVDVKTLAHWSYVHRAVGQDIIIAGHDHPAPRKTDMPGGQAWDRVGTAKAVVDFLRVHLGVRFLYPEIDANLPISAAARIDLLNSPAIEFLPLATAVVPDGLNLSKTPLIRVNTSYPPSGSFYDLAHNRFPLVDTIFRGHTWERAIPVDKYWDSHPEYFALINGRRSKSDAEVAQYCLSNPDVQELILQDCRNWLDRGFSTVDLGQPDSFSACQCSECEKLFNTGQDWSEKIWLFNKQIAESLLKSHPGRVVSMMSYIQTAQPPRTFRVFPPNTSIMLTGTNEQDLAPWRGIDVPQGFTGYVYNWCPNMATRYTPMRTPGHVEAQVKRLTANRIKSLYRDGPGNLFGLEGPVYYVMGRMFDDPENNRATELLNEFYEGAFGDKSTIFYMRAFYDRLYHAIALYSDQLGTRCEFSGYQPAEGEQPRRIVQNPFALIAFMYPPQTIEELEYNLKVAEKQARTEKARSRLALVRTEFEYLKHLSKVIHLYQAYAFHPDESSRERLMSAIDARNVFIDSLYDARGNGITRGNWSHSLFPFPGHDAKHLRLAYDRYQEPYAHTCFNWDTQLLRKSPSVGKKQMVVKSTIEPLTIDSPQWTNAESHQLTFVEPIRGLPHKTTVRLMWDTESLYVYAECNLPPTHPNNFPLFSRDHWLGNQESIELLLQPEPSQNVCYRLAVGANSASRYDAKCEPLAEQLDGSLIKDNPTWNGSWEASCRLDGDLNRWRAMIQIPFETLSSSSPRPDTRWQANFGRNHSWMRDQVDRAVWSSSATSQDINDRAVMGELLFRY